MEPKKLELNLEETQKIIACLSQFKLADVIDVFVKLKAHEQALSVEKPA